jgi:signal transduction histidine kinase
MKRYSIRQYVALITLVPILVIATGLEIFFLKNHFAELDLHSVERAKLIAGQLGTSSEYGVVSENKLFLQNLAQGVIQQQDVRGVAILKSASQILAEAGKFSSAVDITLLSQSLTSSANHAPVISYIDRSLLILQPIMPQTVVLNEFEPPPAAKPIGTIILEIDMARVEKLKSDELWYTIAATAFFFVLAGYIVNFAIRRIINPIKKLGDVIKTIGQGDLETRASVSTRMSEVSILARGVNHMAEQLQHERAVLQQRVDDATVYIRNSKEKAEQATLSKSRFLAAASHDLRQPIHALGMFLDVLSRTELSAKQSDLLDKARSASDASSSMINTLLDYSRIEAGVIKTRVRPFELQSLFHKIENELAPMANKKGIVYRTRDTELAVQSDPALVEVILRNLVSNAIHYTRHGGLLVACRHHGDHAVLEVWDTGIGIAPEQQSEVFREFHQLGDPQRNRNNGLGLGLAIAQGLSRTLEADLSMASTLHRGSVFRLKLPIADPSLPVERIELPVNVPQRLDLRVLVIDDDEAVRIGMCHLLRDWGCKCDSAESIEDALILVRSHVPDVVISDYRLREQRNGIEAITTLRDMLGANLPVLLITGDNSSGLLNEAQANDIPLLHKPVPAGELYRYLLEVLK